MAETLGSSISAALADQIKAREDKFGAAFRDKATLEYLNSNTAWVRLRSSVNVISDGESKALYEKGGTKGSSPGGFGLAESLILAGGALKGNDQRSGIATSANRTSAGSGAYHNSQMGFKPMPGITDVSSKSKGTFGTLREAEVKFKVWSKEDLDDIERVYFRIGYSALLEYGHTVYLDNGGNIQHFTNAKIVGHNTWFSNSAKSKNIDREIQSLRNGANGNYDGIFGFIKNFNWTLSGDGSYDCSVSIISKGVILEGLKDSPNSAHLSAEEQAAKDAAEAEENKNANKSMYHEIMNGIEKQKGFFGRLGSFLSNSNLGSTGNKLQDRDVFGRDVSLGSHTNFILKLLNDNFFCVYLPFSIVLDILNKFQLMKDQNGDVICGFDVNSNEKFTYFSEMFSLDPLVALPPHPPAGEYSFAQISMNDIHSQYAGSTSPDRIVDIMVTSHYVKSKLETLLESPTDPGVGLFEFVKGMCNDINFAFGNVTSLDIFYDEIESQYRIVDRGMPSVNRRPRRITVNGLSNNVLDINVSSKISSNMAAMVSIAAQGNTGNYKDNLDSMLKWNTGCVDRVFISKQQTTKETDPETQEGQKEPFKKRFEDVWKNFNESEVYDPERFNEMKGEGTAVLASSKTKNSVSKGGSPVPIELSLTMKGISLFKIGSVFQVNSTIIPEKYKNFGFIISGVSHSIGTDNQWITEVSTKMYTV